MPTALITGSSRGIGRATAVRFAREGYDVVVNYRTSERAATRTAERIEAETDRRAVVVQADVSDTGAVERLVERTIERFGGIDHVVNNAGIEEFCPTPELTPADFDRLMDVNVNSVFAVSRAALPHLRETDADASITNLSSFIAFSGAEDEAHYASSKSAVLGLTKSLALDFAPDIRVNAIAPGFIDTAMTDHTEQQRHENERTIPLGRYGDPEEIADAAAYLRDATYVTGETVRVEGGVRLGAG